MQLVQCTTDVCGNRGANAELVSELESRLEGLNQIIEIRSDLGSEPTPAPIDEARIRTTATFYHLAALIYFRRQVRHQPTRSPSVQSLVSTALEIASRMEVCTSPWPMFVVACEVINEVQRVQVLEILTNMETQRGMGNISVTRMIVEALWKQYDLRLNEEAQEQIDWKVIVDAEHLCPSFI
jgi:hypothetical protein